MSFVGAARRYWLGVFPRVCLERRRRRARATQIPDPLLRRTALDAQRKWGNVEGAAAFAAFVPRRHRVAAARAMTCFQAAYNYLDMLGEQPCADPAANGRCLHGALLVALDPEARHGDYYEHCPQREDGGYLREILDACRAALATLPGYPALAPATLRAAARIVEFQSCNTGQLQGDLAALERWARGVTPPGEDLRWWETAAAGGSSLGLYALIALAAEPDSWMPDRAPAPAAAATARVDGAASTPAAAAAIADPTGVAAEDAAATLGALAAMQEEAYFPWIGALHSLLDNLVDVAEDRATGQHNLIGLYASPREAAVRMGMLAERSLRAARAQRDPRAHTLVLAAMASFYLSMPEAATPAALPLARAVLGALDGPADLSMLVFRARSRVRGLLPGAPGRRARGAEIVMPGGQARPAPVARPALVARPAPMPRPAPMTPRATAARPIPTPAPVAVGEPRAMGETRGIK
jgi:tetraprenyl-beta-curcumene synthase